MVRLGSRLVKIGKILSIHLAIALLSSCAFAGTIPDNVQQFVSKDFPKTEFRFDGVIILPDNTIYLPLFPAKVLNPESLEIKQTFPSGKTLSDKPNVIIFNNDFSLLKVLTDKNGQKTVYSIANPPVELRTGLLPQDMLVPKGLVVPDSLKSIVGNLAIQTVNDPGIRIEQKKPVVSQLSGSTLKTLSEIPALKNKSFYVSSPYSKNIRVLNMGAKTPEYMLNLESMTLTKQIKITGMCEKLTLSDDGTKLFYYDKKTRDIWAIELDNNYLLKEIGKFPNVSKIVYTNDKIYITSRTKNRVAIIDYKTINLIAEMEICDKPVDMIAFHDRVYVLGAGDNSVQIIDTATDEITNSIYLNTEGFSTKISLIEDTNIALITDTKASLYTVFDLGANKVVKTIPIDIPANSIVVTEKVKKINN